MSTWGKEKSKDFFLNLWIFGQIFPGLLSYKTWNSKILRLDIQTPKLQKNLTMVLGMSVWLLLSTCLKYVFQFEARNIWWL